MRCWRSLGNRSRQTDLEQFERLFCSGVGLLVRVHVSPGCDGGSTSLGVSVPRSESGSAR